MFFVVSLLCYQRLKNSFTIRYCNFSGLESPLAFPIFNFVFRLTIKRHNFLVSLYRNSGESSFIDWWVII